MLRKIKKSVSSAQTNHGAELHAIKEVLRGNKIK